MDILVVSEVLRAKMFILKAIIFTAMLSVVWTLSSINSNLNHQDIVNLDSTLSNEKTFYPFIVQPKSTLMKELTSVGFSPVEVYKILAAAKPNYDLTKIFPGIRYRVLNKWDDEENPIGLEFMLSPQKSLKLWKDRNNIWFSDLTEKKVSLQLRYFSGNVESSLWGSAEKNQMDKQIIADLTEIFAWQIDFSREVQENDKWRLIVEQQLVDGEPVGWGRILAAEYQNQQKFYNALFYEKPGVYSGYFSNEGKSLEKMFLKSPLEFARIYSGFSLKRFHPILGINRPHLGVDYAARPGTPVRALGDGRVLESKFTQAGGNTLVLAHNSIYKTRYLHLKGFASHIHAGQSVKQGQVVGYVGSTGLATGPHLHFEFYQNGKYMDPLKVQLPSAQSIPSSDLKGFLTVAKERLQILDTATRSVASESAHRKEKPAN
jgi:murein DD-endopeptidase MepM/ murein hydrolase activator NlpD